MTNLKSIPMQYDLVSVAFGYVLTQLREQQHMGEDDLARMAGLESSHYRGLESAAYGPSLYCIFRIAAALGTEPEKLVTATCERMVALDSQVQEAAEAKAAKRSDPES